MKAFFEERRPHNGLSYEEYLFEWQEEINTPLEEMEAEDRKYAYYARYNYERSENVFDSYSPSEALEQLVSSIQEPQLWMVLTENWCGDSAYNLPVLVRAAELSDEVTLRILYRDDHPDIMGQYLTGTSRSIPKLVAFAEDGTELFQWGPRPRDLQQLREELVRKGLGKERIIEELLNQYEQGAWRQVDDELVHELHEVFEDTWERS